MQATAEAVRVPMKRKGDGVDAESVEVPVPLIPALEALPSDAIDLRDVIDRRFKDLLALSFDPKDLTAALKAATDWWKAKQEMDAGAGYGVNRGKGTMI